MAKKPTRRGRRRMGRYIKGNVRNTFALGTLSPADVIVDTLDDSVNGRTLISSLDAIWTMSGFTVIDNAGPIMVGISHPDYSDAEIEAWIENTMGWDEGDLIAREVANRKIRRVGIFQQVGQSLGTQTLNDGRPIKTKLNWILNQGTTLKVWAYNTGTVALASTDPDVRVDGHANLWPR